MMIRRLSDDSVAYDSVEVLFLVVIHIAILSYILYNGEQLVANICLGSGRLEHRIYQSLKTFTDLRIML